METFYADVANGTLPAYAFVEPRMFWFHNDYHPPAPLVDGTGIGATSDVRNGELLLHEIYSAVRESAGSGSNALNTLLLVIFDEHGGTYDHVPPLRQSRRTGYNCGENSTFRSTASGCGFRQSPSRPTRPPTR